MLAVHVVTISLSIPQSLTADVSDGQSSSTLEGAGTTCGVRFKVSAIVLDVIHAWSRCVLDLCVTD